jgi:predicted transcriptional regulator
MSEYKKMKLSITDLNIGDFVLGQHVDPVRLQYNIVAGQIMKIDKTDENIIYHIKGMTLLRPHGEPINFSGILNSDEIEIHNNTTYDTVMALYDLANRQIIAEVSYQETIDKIRRIRWKSRQELEAKYPAEAQ